jgi:hypothetical protein
MLEQRTAARRGVSPVQTREELLYLLTRASELEHDLACSYLYAGYSIKTHLEEGGVTPDELETIRGWKRKIASVAVEEMLHLGQVANILTAVGGAPHFARSNLPLPASAFPFGIQITLEPLSQGLIERFVSYEMPEPGILPPERMKDYEELRKRAAGDVSQVESGRVLPQDRVGVHLDFGGSAFHRRPCGSSESAVSGSAERTCRRRGRSQRAQSHRDDRRAR